jgi:hypothetical protein
VGSSTGGFTVRLGAVVRFVVLVVRRLVLVVLRLVPLVVLLRRRRPGMGLPLVPRHGMRRH